MDEFGGKRIVDLSAQVTHVDIDDVGHPLEALVPHVIEYHGPREYTAGRAQEIFEQRVFLRGEVDPVAVAPHLLGQSIQLEIAYAQNVGPLDGRSPQQRLDTHQQLGEIEWLRQVIIRARLEMQHFVVDGIARGEHQDGKSGMRLAHSAQQLRAAQMRKHQVKDEKIVAVRVDVALAFAAVRGQDRQRIVRRASRELQIQRVCDHPRR